MSDIVKTLEIYNSSLKQPQSSNGDKSARSVSFNNENSHQLEYSGEYTWVDNVLLTSSDDAEGDLELTVSDQPVDRVTTYKNSHVFVNTTNFFPIASSINRHNALETNCLDARLRRKVPTRNKIMVAISVSIIGLLFVLWMWRLFTFSLSNSRYNFLWLPVTFFSVFVLLFPVHIFVSGLFNMLGSTEFFFKNNKYYSCIKEPTVNSLEPRQFYSVTIQIPVYKEDFDSVIKPTIKSAILCRKYYDIIVDSNVRVNIFINDDGLQAIDKEEEQKRISYYTKHDIGFVARPKDGRAGRFKKASNMNTALKYSKIYSNLIKKFTSSEAHLVAKFMLANKGRICLAGGDVSVGDFILLLDSDTRIPFNCLHDVIKEFESDPKLGFTQHLTYPLIVTNTYWEKFIAHFTTLIYDLAMPISVSGGDVSPMVGHCAILRASALRELEEKKKSHKIWSEDNVSEDFKLFMDLTIAGYYGRYVTYTSNINTKYFEKHNFMEGISLEYIDELAKFKKYAYGTCEILFNPVGQWCRKGVIGKQIRDYCGSNIEFTSKVGIVSYLFTYFAIAASLPLSFLNFFTYGWVETSIDTQVLPLYVILQISMLFSAWGTFTNSVFKARILRKDVINVIWYNIVQTPFYVLFFGSLPFHIILVMGKYFYNSETIVWGSTQKEVSYSSKLEAIVSTLKEFKLMYIFFTSTLICLGFLHSSLVVDEWRIVNINAVVPLVMTSCFHLLGPMLLNPYIMTNNKLKRLADLEDEHNLNLFINEVDV